MTIMRKKLFPLLVALLLVVTALPSSAQTRRNRNETIIKAYPVLGACVSQIEGDELKGFKHWGFTAGVGAIVDLTSNHRWQLSLETDYALRGVKETVRNQEIYYNIKDFDLHYVDIPMLVHFTDPYGGLTAGLGLCYSRLVSQPHGEIQYSPTYVVPDTTDMEFLRNDLSAVASFRFPIWRNLKLDLRAQYSLFPVKKDWQFQKFRNKDDAGNPVYDSWTRDLYNFSITGRLMWVFGEKYYKKPVKKTQKGELKRIR